MTEPAELRPSLGREVVPWMEEKLVFGPGPVRGTPYRLTLELKALTWQVYEVFPQGHRLAGHRCYSEAYLSRAKGLRKTEWMGGIGAAEFAGGPVRCDGFDASGRPVGVPVKDPDCILLATTEEQAQDLAFTRASVMLTEGPLADLIYATQDLLQLANGPGKLYSVTSRAKSKDGYIPTWAGGDEPHLWTTAELHELYRVVWEGLAKRLDSWGLLTSTAYAPGEGSVAEKTHELYRAIVAGEVKNFGLLFDHLEASSHYDLDDDAQLREAILEASGLATDGRNVEGIIGRFRDPRNDPIKLRRYWLNQILKAANAWLNPDDIAAVVDLDKKVRRREAIVLGFDGSLYDDATVLLGKRLSDGHVFVIGIWEQPDDPREARLWRVPTEDVDRAVRRAFREYDVVRGYFDLHHWQDFIDHWSADFGDRVVRFDTRQPARMARAIERAETNVRNRALTLDGHPTLIAHLENARTKPLSSAARHIHTDTRAPVGALVKESRDLKIDSSIALCLLEEAAADVVELGLMRKRRSSKLRVH